MLDLWNKKRGCRSITNVTLTRSIDTQTLAPSRCSASCLKDVRFLDFFFKRVRRNPYQHTSHDGVDDDATLTKNSFSFDDCAYVSRCGNELNFIRPDDTPVVYRALVPTPPPPPKKRRQRDGNNGDDTANTADVTDAAVAPTLPPLSLLFGGSLTVPFDGAQLSVCAHTGRVYHPAPPSSEQPLFAADADAEIDGGVGDNFVGRALLTSSLVQELIESKQLCCDDEGDDDDADADAVVWRWKGAHDVSGGDGVQLLTTHALRK
jgi:hypothetical protein